MDELRSTRRRYLAALGSVGAAGLAGCSNTLAGELLRSEIDERTRERYVDVATRTADELEEWHRARGQTTRRLSQFDVAQNGTPDERHEWLLAEAERLPEDVYEVHLVDPTDDWTIVASTSGPYRGELLTTREAPWQNDSLDYGPNGVFAARAIEALARSLVSFVAHLGPDENRRLVMQTDMDELARTLSQPSGGVYSRIVDGDGRVVTGTREIERLERNDGSLSTYPGASESAALMGALGGESGFVAEPVINDSDEVDGDEPYVVAYAPVETRDWAVLTHVPKETAKDG